MRTACALSHVAPPTKSGNNLRSLSRRRLISSTIERLSTVSSWWPTGVGPRSQGQFESWNDWVARKTETRTNYPLHTVTESARDQLRTQLIALTPTRDHASPTRRPEQTHRRSPPHHAHRQSPATATRPRQVVNHPRRGAAAGGRPRDALAVDEEAVTIWRELA